MINHGLDGLGSHACRNIARFKLAEHLVKRTYGDVYFDAAAGSAMAIAKGAIGSRLNQEDVLSQYYKMSEKEREEIGLYSHFFSDSVNKILDFVEGDPEDIRLVFWFDS